MMALKDRIVYCEALENKARSLGIRCFVRRPKVSENEQQGLIEVRARINWVAEEMKWHTVSNAFFRVIPYKHYEDILIDGNMTVCQPTDVIDRIKI